MKKQMMITSLLILAFSLMLTAGEVKLGGEFTIQKATPISQILEKPADFEGKLVLVEGYIVDGCMHEGTWLSLAGDKDFTKLMIQDKENKMKFPLDHKGKYAIVEGTVYFKMLTEEQATKWLQHLAEIHKQPADLSQAKGGMKLYKVSPVAAIIKDAK